MFANKTFALKILPTALVMVGLTGCASSNLNPFAADEQEKRAAQLATPPAFTGPAPGGSVALPEIASARADAMAREQGGAGGVLAAGADVRVAGDPESRYLEVSADPETLWPRLQSFLRDEGYTLARTEPSVGLIETNWYGVDTTPERGFSLGNLFGVLKNIFFKPDSMEKVRVRIEHGETPEQTLVFVSAQSRQLTADDPVIETDEASGFRYASAQNDPDLSFETMTRLAAYLGGKSAEEAREIMQAQFTPRAKVIPGDEPEDRYIESSQQYPLVYNRLGLALDRLDFDPVSRDREEGQITVRHSEPQALYQGLVLRGVSVDQAADITLDVTFQLVPAGARGTDVAIDRIEVSGGELPQIRAVLLSRITEQLQ